MICSIISNTNIIVKRMMQQEQIESIVQQTTKNLPIEYNYDSVNSAHYSLDPIAAIKTGMEGYDAVNVDSQQRHLIITLVYVFDVESNYNIYFFNGFKKTKNKLEFEFKEKNVDCDDFVMEYAVDDGFDCDTCTLSPILSSSFASSP